jgi:hypothetical protein
MPGKKKPGPSVKDDKVYEAIRDQGGSKEKAARIANASAARSRSSVGKKGWQVRLVRRLEGRRLAQAGQGTRHLGLLG